MCSLSSGKTVSEERPDPERQKGQTRTQVLWLKTCWFLGLLHPMFLGTVISGKVKWGRMTEEVRWGRDTQLFQTNSHQLFFFAGKERRNGVHQHLFRHAQQEEGLWESSWDEVTMRLLLYSLYSVRVLFTPELLRLGLMGNVQSRRLLINAVSGFWQQ